MKIFQLLISLLFSIGSLAQCPDTNIILENQYQVDMFSALYPNCEHIKYGLNIRGSYGTPGTAYDFSNMPPIKTVGVLSIETSKHIKDLNFISNIESIDKLMIQRNQDIKSLEFLKTVRINESVIIEYNPKLTDIKDLNINYESFEYIRIYNNPALEECNTDLFCEILSNNEVFAVLSENGNSDCQNIFDVAINCGTGFPSGSSDSYSLTNQTDINNFQTNFPELRTIGKLFINNSDDSDITSLLPLKFLDTIQFLSIKDCQGLTSLNGLDSIYNVTLAIENCQSLEEIEVINTFQRLSTFRLENCNEIKSLSHIDFKRHNLYSITLRDLPNLKEEVLNLDTVKNRLKISNLNWNNLTPLSKLTSAETFSISSMPELNSVHGMDNLRQLNSLDLWTLPNLSTLTGFNEIKRIKSISLLNLGKLSHVENCFSQVDSIKTQLIIRNNEYLKDIGEFENLKYIGSCSIRENPELTDLNIFNQTINIKHELSIANNKKLDICNFPSVCNKLFSESSTFSGNAFGCNFEILYENCYPENVNPIFDVIINSQNELDSFAQKYPLADSILANLIISDIDKTSKITDLSYFEQINYIEGELSLNHVAKEIDISAFYDIDFD